MTDQDGWLSGKKEIANHLGVTGRTVSRLFTKYRDFPVHMIGRRMMAKPKDLDSWVKKHAVKPCEKCGELVVS
jgi:hypothetical protein